jgi:hypothetical protein
MLTRIKFLITACILTGISTSAFADSSANAILQSVSNYADKTCSAPDLYGSHYTENISAELSMTFPGFLKKLLRNVDISFGVTGNQRFGLSKQDFLALTKDQTQCRQSVIALAYQTMNRFDIPPTAAVQSSSTVTGLQIVGSNNIITNSGNVSEYNKTSYIQAPNPVEEQYYRVKIAEEAAENPTNVMITQAFEQNGQFVLALQNQGKYPATDVSVHILGIQDKLTIAGTAPPANLEIEPGTQLPFTLADLSGLPPKNPTLPDARQLLGFGVYYDLNRQCWDTDISPGLAEVCSDISQKNIHLIFTQGVAVEISYQTLFGERKRDITQFLVYSAPL